MRVNILSSKKFTLNTSYYLLGLKELSSNDDNEYDSKSFMSGKSKIFLNSLSKIKYFFLTAFYFKYFFLFILSIAIYNSLFEVFIKISKKIECINGEKIFFLFYRKTKIFLLFY